MDARLGALLGRLEGEGARYDAGEASHARRRLNLERPTAELVALLVRVHGARRVLEIGTSNGVSALWIADALRDAGGRLVTVERDAEKSAQAGANLREAGLEAFVELRVGDATAVVRELAGPFDAVFFDADRWSAPEQLAILLPKLSARALLMADNALSHPEEIAGYLAAVGRREGFRHAVVPVGKGLSVAFREGAGPA